MNKLDMFFMYDVLVYLPILDNTYAVYGLSVGSKYDFNIAVLPKFIPCGRCYIY